jgi:hypothetical protein
MFNHPIFSNKIPIIYPQRFWNKRNNRNTFGLIWHFNSWHLLSHLTQWSSLYHTSILVWILLSTRKGSQFFPLGFQCFVLNNMPTDKCYIFDSLVSSGLVRVVIMVLLFCCCNIVFNNSNEILKDRRENRRIRCR